MATSGGGGLIYEARIEDGKLFYENRWFHKGQHIFIESKEHGQERYMCMSYEAWRRFSVTFIMAILLTAVALSRPYPKARSVTVDVNIFIAQLPIYH